MMPDGEKLKEIKLTDHPEIDIKKIFEVINQRIEYLYDRDHTIGHSYLMNITNFAGLENAFKNKIIPLLQEYFYDDWEKIRLILADNQINNEDYEFIIEKKDIVSKKLFGEKTISDNIDFDEEKKVYEFNMNAFTSPESYTKIYDSNNIQKNDDNMSDDKKNESEEI
jgi:5-methylcytosine-specific restriction protein B